MSALIHHFYDAPLTGDELGLLVNRQTSLSLLDESIEGAERGQLENYAILGEEGMGKSSLVNLAYEKARGAKSLLPVRLDITADTTELLFFKELCRQLVDGIQLGFIDKMAFLLRAGERTESLLREARDLVTGITKSEGTATELSFGLLNLVQFSIGGEAGFSRRPPIDVTEATAILQSIIRLLAVKYKAVIVLVDEAGYVASEKTQSLLQRVRLFFQTRPFMTVMAGNPRLIDELTKVVPEVSNMFPEGNRIHLEKLSEQDTWRLVESRILSGENPFSDPQVVYAIWRESEGNPRYVIRICREGIRILKREGRKTATVETVDEAASRILAVKGKDIFNKLTLAQQEVAICLCQEGGSSYPSAVEMKLKKSQGRVSQILSELHDLGYVLRSREGRRAIYSLSKPLLLYLRQLVAS